MEEVDSIQVDRVDAPAPDSTLLSEFVGEHSITVARESHDSQDGVNVHEACTIFPDLLAPEASGFCEYITAEIA